MEHILTGTQHSEELPCRDRLEVYKNLQPSPTFTNLEALRGLALGLLTFTQHPASST